MIIAIDLSPRILTHALFNQNVDERTVEQIKGQTDTFKMQDNQTTKYI